MLKSRNFIRLATISATLAAGVCSCIKNDIPYPRIQADFLTFEAENQDQGAVIDPAKRTVTLYFGENVDIENVNVSTYSITPGAEIVDGNLDEPLNLSKPYYLNLRLYQNWQWSISAVQNIERYFEVAGQVGSSFIDVPGRRVIVYVSENTRLSDVFVERIKLGSTESVLTPDLEGKRVNLSRPLEISVQDYGRITKWTIFAEQTASAVTTLRVDAWTNVAWVYARGEAGVDHGIEYRIAGDTEWTRVEKADITTSGGDFFGRIIHLSAGTAYQARAYSGEDSGEVIDFTTGQAIQMPNTNLDQWSQDGRLWNPWAEGETPFWDTGNKGATTIGQSNSVPTDDTSTGEGWAAMLQTKFVGVGMLGKIAAGNIFVGEYYKTEGTNGILHFGRRFNERPTKVRGYLKYTNVPIDYVSKDLPQLKGQPDTCIVWCALIDQNEPFEVRTNPANRQLFDPQGDYVVAYGKIQFGETIPQYIPFEFELNYTSTERVPKYILLTASASKYGDYFTGGNGSVLYLDDLELIYDY